MIPVLELRCLSGYCQWDTLPGVAYFTEREPGGLPPPTSEQLTAGVSAGIAMLVRTRILDGSFGFSYPYRCWEHPATVGTDEELLSQAMAAFLPGVPLPLNGETLAGNLKALNLVEFTFQKIAQPHFSSQASSHESFAQHRHLSFDQYAGRELFRGDVNQLFAAHGLAFNLGEDGKVIRTLSPGLSEALGAASFNTGDGQLDSLLESARTKFLSPTLSIRQEALEKLWDALERTKTLAPGDKKESVALQLEKASPEPRLRERLNIHLNELTFIGNNFMIRHTETDKIPIGESRQVDYLFHWLFAAIQLLLRADSRM